MVVAEANSAGLPVIASDTGGMSSAIRTGKNGFLIPITNRLDEVNRYADAIQSSLTPPGCYRNLSLSSLQESRDRLNWNVAAGSVIKIIENILR
jgi:glycosyltransferase involved in cell wall biosynthesis